MSVLLSPTNRIESHKSYLITNKASNEINLLIYYHLQVSRTFNMMRKYIANFLFKGMEIISI